jgi:acetyl-CoA decarbonylase/synthase complex subunit delta
MEVPEVAERWNAGVNELTLGATAAEGGTRTSTVTIGGERSVPFMTMDGVVGHRPVVAMDVLDIEPEGWSESLLAAYGDVVKDPVAWARKCVEEFAADLVCVKLEGVARDKGDKGAEEAVALVRSVLQAVGVPLIVWGSEDWEKDEQVLPKVSEALKGERALLGPVTQNYYKTLTAVCIADGHALITLAPLDINIAKQVNILVSDMGFPLERVVTFPTTGALGYGLEYAYSIQERERLAALGGDKMMSMPVICDVGHEAWRAKESRTPTAEAPAWGDQEERGIMWETVTATALLQAGCDILRMRHPQAVATVKRMLDELFVKR